MSMKDPFDWPPASNPNSKLRSAIYQEPVIEYNPDLFLSWKGGSDQPIPGFVFPRDGKDPPIRGVLVPGALRVHGKKGNFPLEYFQTNSPKPIWYLEPGSSTPVKVISGFMFPRTAYKSPTPAYYVPEHVLLENPLARYNGTKYVFVPTHTIRHLVNPPPDPGRLEVTYVSAAPSMSPLPAYLRVDNNSIKSRLEEEIRLRNIYEGYIHYPGRTDITLTPYDFSGTFSKVMAFAVEAIGTAATFFVSTTFLLDYFTSTR